MIEKLYRFGYVGVVTSVSQTGLARVDHSSRLDQMPISVEVGVYVRGAQRQASVDAAWINDPQLLFWVPSEVVLRALENETQQLLSITGRLFTLDALGRRVSVPLPEKRGKGLSLRDELKAAAKASHWVCAWVKVNPTQHREDEKVIEAQLSTIFRSVNAMASLLIPWSLSSRAQHLEATDETLQALHDACNAEGMVCAAVAAGVDGGELMALLAPSQAKLLRLFCIDFGSNLEQLTVTLPRESFCLLIRVLAGSELKLERYEAAAAQFAPPAPVWCKLTLPPLSCAALLCQAEGRVARRGECTPRAGGSRTVLPRRSDAARGAARWYARVVPAAPRARRYSDRCAAVAR